FHFLHFLQFVWTIILRNTATQLKNRIEKVRLGRHVCSCPKHPLRQFKRFAHLMEKNRKRLHKGAEFDKVNQSTTHLRWETDPWMAAEHEWIQQGPSLPNVIADKCQVTSRQIETRLQIFVKRVAEFLDRVSSDRFIATQLKKRSAVSFCRRR